MNDVSTYLLLSPEPALSSNTPSIDNDLQGDIEHYSIQKQITRRLNKKSPGFLSAVRMIWEATRAEMVDRLHKSLVASVPSDGDGDGTGAGGSGGAEDGSCGIDKAAFVCLMVKVHYLIICPPVRNHPFLTNIGAYTQ